MKPQSRNCWIHAALALVPVFFLQAAFGAEKAEPVRIIFDTDMDTDCDDAGALAMLHALAARGEVRILATVVSSKYPYSAPCVEAINRYHGRADLPVGVPKGRGASTSRGSRYARTIAAEFETALKTGDDAPSAAEVYRRVLAAQPDRSVVVVTVGYLTNLRDLLQTEGDTISPLSGPELVRAKVKFLSCMGGRYPEHLDPGVFGNFKPDPEAAVEVARDWPRPIFFSGDGNRIQTGRRLRRDTPSDNPARRVYELYLRDRPTRPSWDQVALLYAVRPEAPYWTVKTQGCNHIFPNGTNQWRDEPDDPRHRLVAIRPESRERIQEMIDKLMAHIPGGDEKGFVSLFNGRDLTGWKGDRTIWSVEDGAIVGETTPEHRIRENNYLIWEGEVEDFELRLCYRIEAGNSGIYCRARKRPEGQDTPDPIIAWQADIDAEGKWTGVIMEWTGRDKLAERGSRVEIDEEGNRKVAGSLGDPDELWAQVKKDGWNDYVVTARGGHITLEINGVKMAELMDRDPRRLKQGLLALQVHVGPPMRVAFRDIRLKKLAVPEGASGPAAR